MATETLAGLRDRTEAEVKVPTGDAYIDSADELDDVNEAYKAAAYRYDWPELLDRTGLIPVANVGRYTLSTNFRKARYIRNVNLLVKETEFDLFKYTPRSFAIDRVNSDLVLREIPSAAPTSYTLSNSESAGNAVTIELNTSSGLAAGDEIWIDAAAAANEEFTFVSSVPGSTSITARLKRAKAASDILYLVKEIIDVHHYKTITLLSEATDTMILPDAADFIIPHGAAFFYFEREQQYERAKQQLDIFNSRLSETWLSHDKTSTGAVTTFSVR